eukprot:TRINITY_DN4713_c0_g4_i1.p1 TRINITY_DN4713_c0_g4~~TRINITY_DN4713_c0_g4_i1.p1  ORF type:complete len:310 (-),score=68.34 TRINITY_DN4713_c0_g4_i1:255-1184(-)
MSTVLHPPKYIGKENKKSGSFLKSIDLKTGQNTLQQPNKVQTESQFPQPECPQSQSAKKDLNKQNSFCLSDNNSRRFSLFSKTSFATSSSFLFGTRIFNKTKQSVPKVNIQNIFKEKAYLYLDQDLQHVFDDLLDKGYDMVSNKKEERDILKSGQENMLAEIQQLEKDIVPLQNSITNNKEVLNHQKELQQKYESEIMELQKEQEELQKQIINRMQEIQQDHDKFTNEIKQAELNNNEIACNIQINKAQHRQEMNELQQQKKKKLVEQDKLVKILTETKKAYEEKKLSLADRLRKMENKQKMFIGILKH